MADALRQIQDGLRLQHGYLNVEERLRSWWETRTKDGILDPLVSPGNMGRPTDTMKMSHAYYRCECGFGMEFMSIKLDVVDEEALEPKAA